MPAILAQWRRSPAQSGDVPKRARRCVARQQRRPRRDVSDTHLRIKQPFFGGAPSAVVRWRWALCLLLAACCGPVQLNAQDVRKAFTLPSGAQIVLQLGPAADGLSFSFSPDELFVLSAGGDHIIRLWDIRTGRLLRTYENNDEPINQAVFSPDGTRILSGGGDGLRLWDVQSGALLRSMRAPHDEMAGDARSVAFSADGKYVLSGHRDHKIRLWNAETGSLIRVFESLGEEVGSVALSPDGRWAVAAGRFGNTNDGVALWDVGTGAIVRHFKVDEGPLSTLAHPPWSPSRTIAPGVIGFSVDG